MQYHLNIISHIINLIQQKISEPFITEIHILYVFNASCTLNPPRHGGHQCFWRDPAIPQQRFTGGCVAIINNLKVFYWTHVTSYSRDLDVHFFRASFLTLISDTSAHYCRNYQMFPLIFSWSLIFP